MLPASVQLTLRYVETVIIDGHMVEDRDEIPGVDERELGERMQAGAEEYWARFPEWDYASRSANEVFPLSLRERSR